VDHPRVLKNNRAFPRLRHRLKLTVGPHRAFTSDVSLGGFSVEMMQVLPPGVGTQGVLYVGSAEIPFAGIVRWSKQGAPGAGRRGRMGVRFDGVSEAFKQALVGLGVQ
jgi:hypothetical protein